MNNKKKLLRLTESLYSQPHLISQQGFNAISQYLDNRNKFGLMDIAAMPADDSDNEDDVFDPMSGVGVIDVIGAMSYKTIYGMCGAVGVSYESILEQAENLIEAGATTIILNMDSGGGQAYGVFECSEELRKMCDESSVKLYAYNDGCCASACYALAAVCDEVVTNPFAETGSIGVLICLMNNSGQLAQEGLVRSFVTAGAEKIPFDAEGNFRESFIADLQTKVDSLYGDFVAHVSKYTGLSAEAIRATEAKTFLAPEAKELGLVNAIMTRSEFAAYILSKQTQGAQYA